MPLYTSPALLTTAEAALMAPTIVGTGSEFFSSSGLTSYTMVHTVPAGANCLVVGVGYCKQNGAHNLTDVSWNGVSLTQLHEDGGLSFTAGRATFWIGALAAPASGTFNIVASMDVAPDNLALYALNLAGVDVSGGGSAMAAAADGAGVFFYPNTNALSVSLAPAFPSLLFGGMALAQPPGAASYTPGSGVTELTEGTASGPAAARHFFGYRRETVAGTYDFAATCTQSSACGMAVVAFKGG